jgi:hypothetical protein
VASLLPGRRSEINIYGSADIDSRFLPDQLTLTHGFCRQGSGNGVPGGEPAAGAALPLPGAGLQQGRRRTLVLTPGGHLRYRTVPFSTCYPDPAFKNSPDTRLFPIHKLS